MSNRLTEWCDKNKCLSDYQAAYKQGVGCEEHIFVLNAALQMNTSKRRKVYALFVDLSKAFDGIRHRKLWSNLHSIGLSNKFIRNIQCIYSKAKATNIRTNYGMSPSFNLTNSVLQGETLSPKLFTLFVEDIVSILKKSGIASIKLLL
jgi:hypothetical protein